MMSPLDTETDKRLVKGQRTRDRLLLEALRLFAEKGYAGVGTREVAAAAETNVASIAFHFSGKEGLYGAVVAYVAEELAHLHQVAMATAKAECMAKEDVLLQIERTVYHITKNLLTSNRSQWMSLLLQREFITPTKYYDIIYDLAVKPTLETLSSWLATLHGNPVDGISNKILSFSMFILASAFQRNKETFLHFSGEKEYSQDDIALIAQGVASFVRHGLSATINK